MIRCKKSSMVYIGSSVDITRRFKEHFKSLVKRKHCNWKLQADFNKWGVDGFEKRILQIVDSAVNRDDLYQHEQKWLNLMEDKYNICQEAKPKRYGG